MYCDAYNLPPLLSSNVLSSNLSLRSSKIVLTYHKRDFHLLKSFTHPINNATIYVINLTLVSNFFLLITALDFFFVVHYQCYRWWSQMHDPINTHRHRSIPIPNQRGLEYPDHIPNWGLRSTLKKGGDFWADNCK